MGIAFLRRAIPLVASVFATVRSGSAMDLNPGDLYASNNSHTISHFDEAGNYVDSFTVPTSFGSSVKGLAFGPTGLLYAVTITGSGFNVIAIDNSGTVQQTYSGSEYVQGNLSSGKIDFASNGEFFVCGENDLVAFTPGKPTGSVIYSNNQVFDVDGLPSGNLLVLSAYDLQEITPTGSLVRDIPTSIRLVDARGVEYDPAANEIYVTMLGYTGQFFSLMRLNGTTGQVDVNSSFRYGDAIARTGDGRIIVGSSAQAPGILDLNLNPLGTLGSGQQQFVTQMPAPEPASVAALGLTCVGLMRNRRKRSAARALWGEGESHAVAR